jgi:ubiquinone/menaquinone biosynthesis C-methylase UbiE
MSEPMAAKKFWDDGAGFFGRNYMEGDNSLEGYLKEPQRLDGRTKREVGGVSSLLALQPGQRILDCPTGYGRHAIGLAQMGFEVVGSDINSEMLAGAATAAGEMTGVSFVKENMQDLSYSNEFDAVINLFFSIGFFETEEENNAVVRNFYNALKPGGKFMMHTDINIPRIVAGDYKLHERRNLISGRQLEIIESYDPSQKRLTGQWILIGPDETRQELPVYSHRIYTFDDFAELCYATGFKSVKGYGDWEGTPLSDTSEDMIVVAEKP